MKKFLFAALSTAILMSPIAGFAQSSGGGCGPIGYPCNSVQMGRGVTLTDRSGSISIEGTAQLFAPANPARTGCEIQNLSSGDLWFNEMGTATPGAGSWDVTPGSDRSCDPTGVGTGAISIFGSTVTGAPQQFTAREW
jgi:hypothetical protein